MEIDYLIVIPARFKSSRFEGKPLADINGKSMIERVWLKCLSAAPENQIIVATDDKRIYSHCKTKKNKYNYDFKKMLNWNRQTC